MKVSVRFEGGAELAKNLATLSKRVNQNVARKALLRGGEPIRAAAERIVRQRDPLPDIRDHIGMSFPKKSKYLDVRGEVAVVAIGPTRGYAYGLPLEIGTVDHPPFPFMRPAFDGNTAKALGEINLEFRRELIERGVDVGSARIGQGSSESFGEDTPDVMGGPGGGGIL